MGSARRVLDNLIGGLPRAFWYLWTGSLINRLGSAVLVFMAIYLTQERGFSDARAGLVIGLWGAGGAAGSLLGGYLADRWGRRPTLLTAHLGAATLMVAMGFARDLPTLAGCALLLGLFAEAARPAFSAMMIDVVPERDRVRAFSLNYWAVNVGFAAAAILGGFAARIDYLLLFLINAVTIVITAVIIFVKVREVDPGRRGALPPVVPAGGAGPAPVGALRTILRDRVFLGLTGLNLFSALVFLQASSMLPIAMTDDGLDATTYGYIIALNGVLIVAGQLFVPRLIGRSSHSRVVALGVLLSGVGFGLTAFADLAWLYALTVLIWTLGEMINSPSNSTLVATLSPAALRGRYQGVFSLSWQLAGALAPTLGGLVRETAGDATLWLGCFVLTALVSLGHLLARPARERRAAELRAAALGTATLPQVPISGAAQTKAAAASGN